MADSRNISDILQDWDYDSQSIRARIVAGQDGEADVLQMRVEMGIIQMAVDGRPDGIRPEGFATYLDYLLQEEIWAQQYVKMCIVCSLHWLGRDLTTVLHVS